MRKLLLTAAVAGTMALGLAAAPAQAATVTTPLKASVAGEADSASNTLRSAGPDNAFQYYGPGREGYFLGYWYKDAGGGSKYYFGGRLVDKHRQKYTATWVRFKYFDKFGRKHVKLVKTTKKFIVRDIRFKKDLDVQVCTAWHHRCGSWHDVF